ncbi:MAG: hypothetical protein KC731_01405 [Myxococcales bacterium]|nr:hypothetical protein [Myxococcales bacterium]
MTKTAWERAYDAVGAALRDGDIPRADDALSMLWREAEARGVDELVANTHFTEGRVHDAARRFERAEASFVAALDLDRALGRAPGVIADVFHSLGIVRRNLGDDDGALDAFRNEVELLREADSPHLTSALCSLGGQLLHMGRLELALTAYQSAEAAAEGRQVPLHEVAKAYLGQGEALRQSKRYQEAYQRLAIVTRLGARAAQPWPALVDVVARAWQLIGVLCRYAFVEREAMAAAAFWYAAELGEPEVAARARAELRTLQEAQDLEGDPFRYRVVHREDGWMILAAADGALLQASAERMVGEDLAIWDEVDVELDGLEVLSVGKSAGKPRG